jgi:hypothetical protein
MGKPVLLQNKFLGFKRDMSRDQIPKDYLYEMTNLLPDVGAPLRSRGAWTTQGSLWTSIYASAAFPSRVVWAPFQSAGQLVGFDTNGRVLDLTNSVDRGAGTVPLHTPVFFRNLLLWADGAATPKKYDGTTISALGGSPPSVPRCAAIWTERLLLSGASSDPATSDTIYFSAAGNVDSWDTTNAYVRMNGPIQGLSVLRSGILAFHAGQVERIRGDTPPSSTNIGNLSRDVLFNTIGLFEPNAFAASEDFVVWADKSGVYQSDGAALTNLTKQGGIDQFWKSLMVSPPTTLAVGLWHDYAIVAISDTYTLVCELKSRNWFNFSNVAAKNFTVRPDTSDWLLFSPPALKRAARLDPAFLGGGGTDGDGSVPVRTWGVPFYRFGSQGKKRAKYAYVSYDARTPNTVSVAYADSPEKTTQDGALDGFPVTTKMERKRVALSRPLNGAWFNFTGTAATGDLRFYALEMESLEQEQSRRA